jgi:hypothetical protein
MHYRQIWEQTNGPIHIDEQGRPYEIHHIDGNRKNNDLSNLKCVTVEEHYNIHLEQKDYYAAFIIGQRLNRSIEELDEIKRQMSLAKKGRPSSFTGKKHSEESKRKMSESAKRRGIPEERQKRMALARVGVKRGPFSDEHKAKLSASHKGKPNKHKGVPYGVVECPHCSKIGGAPGMKKHHFNNCEKYLETRNN